MSRCDRGRGSIAFSAPSGRNDQRLLDVPAIACYCDTRALDASHTEAALRLLSKDERQQHDRFGFAADRRDYALAHALLRLALASHVSTSPQRLTFEKDANGKPFLCHPKTSPTFSLSHSRGLVACAIASEAVGIDVEAIDASVRVADIARDFFSADEVAALDRCSIERRLTHFYELWTLKEALLKAVGVGLGWPLSSASFRVRGRLVSVTTTWPFDAERWSFSVTGAVDTHKLAVAVRSTSAQGPRVRLIRADPFAIVQGVLRSGV